ncbi:MAG: Glu-tRNA(Gln) amidotransferase subunit GatE [Candidatus Aenigmatarchaeota archaeon]|nr:Glu-tRNA(Gln) amidotransferase subunit GatE [Candidatus Aenigmarchaeota archaeon]
MDWQQLGLKVGLEIHWGLNTEKKLFCSCPNTLINRQADKLIERYLRPAVGELGGIDEAAKAEALKGKKIIYEFFDDANCLVEIDEEPPHSPNKHALESSFLIAEMLNAKIVDEIHVMRKTIIDGSNVSGFQRTMLIAMDGFVKTSFGNVGISSICLEEDSSRIIDSKKNIFRLDRLGMPEVEITTTPDIHTPEQALEAAEKIGMILLSSGKVKTGLGVVRQDVNVSIKDGARTEIKHVQRLNWIPLVIEKEVERQLQLIKKGEKIENSVRVAKEDGSNVFLRPIAGSARMYPETDVMSILVDKKLIEKIKNNLPETIDVKLEKMKKVLPNDVAEQLSKSEKLFLFEKIVSEVKADPTIVASTLVYTLKDIKRKGVDVDSIEDKQFIDLFKMLKDDKIAKEAIPQILEKLNDKKVEDVVSELGLLKITRKELEKIVDDLINENRNKIDKNAYGLIMGLVMKKVRGRIDGSVVDEVVKDKLKNMA